MAETFNDWWGSYAAREFGADERGARIARSIALDVWVARQSEIDVLRAELGRTDEPRDTKG